MLIWKSKLKSICINKSKNWPNNPRFGCETFVGVKHLDDFGDVKTNFLDHIEKEFED
jgi:hypothetical protein